MKPFWTILRTSWAFWIPFGRLLGGLGSLLGGSWAEKLCPKSPPRAILDCVALIFPYFGSLGSPWEPLGASWEPLGSLLEASWASLGPSWEALGSILEPSWNTFDSPKALGKHLGSDFLESRKTLKNTVRYCKIEVRRSLISLKISY